MQRHEVRLADATASYLEWTPTDAVRSTVVLLHGGGLDSAVLSWGDFGGRLAAAGDRVLAPDAPGYGHSPLASWPSTQENLVGFVAEFVDTLGLEGFVLGGLSMGGGMTLGYALERPDRVRGIIPMGSAGIMDRQRDAWWARGMHLLTWLSVRSGLVDASYRWFAGSRRLTEWSLTQIVRDPARRTSALLDAVMAEAGRSSGAVAFGQWQRDQILVDRIRTSYLSRAGELTMPALVIHGEHDVGVPAARAEELALALPNARLVVAPGAGHWVTRDAPDLVAAAVLDFLRTL